MNRNASSISIGSGTATAASPVPACRDSRKPSSLSTPAVRLPGLREQRIVTRIDRHTTTKENR